MINSKEYYNKNNIYINLSLKKNIISLKEKNIF